jgi:hypothetical protein
VASDHQHNDWTPNSTTQKEFGPGDAAPQKSAGGVGYNFRFQLR